MRVMYIAPRFHTNQIDIIKGWAEHGDQVCFVSHYQGKTENYSYLEPVVLGYSKFFLWFHKFYTKVLFPGKPNAGDIKLRLGFPPMRKLANVIRGFHPDIVILREKSVYSMCAYHYCKKYNIKSILYNQSPLWENEIKNDFFHKLVNALCPEKRMTPVLGEKTPDKIKDRNAFYVPFVMEPKVSPQNKKQKEEQTIQIFSVGKYEERKNHKMLLQAAEEISKKFPIKLVIAGECSTEFHEKYFRELSDEIEEKNMGKTVTLFQNLNREQMAEQYKEADVFIIPSTREPASISQLEAMAYSLPVICSDKNGTACYVEEGVNGYLFRDNDVQSLIRVVVKMIEDSEKMRSMGKESYGLIMEKYQFVQYYEKVKKIIHLI